MVKIILIHLFALSVILFTSCSNIDRNLETLEPPPYKPNFKIYRCNDSLFFSLTYLSTNQSNRQRENFVKSLQNVYIHFRQNKRIIKTLYLKPFKFSERINETSSIDAFVALSKYQFPSVSVRYNELSLDVVIILNNRRFLTSGSFNSFFDNSEISNNATMEIVPIITRMDSVSYLFGMLALRTAQVENEYLPDSEDFRAEIFNHKFNTLWSSNFNKNYTTQINKVEPTEIDSMHFYYTIWNGKGNNLILLPEYRDYKLKLSIPAKPYPYSYVSDFRLESN